MNSTSTSNSTFPSVLSGAAAGGAAGMGLALATKPYLKNGKPNFRLGVEMGTGLVCLEPEYKTIMENSAKNVVACGIHRSAESGRQSGWKPFIRTQ